ncbi:hypothetical protein ACE6H2_017820 [Prunus campanulata]
MLGKRVQPTYADLSTKLGLTAPLTVPHALVIKSHSNPRGEDKEHAKKYGNESSNEVVAPLNGRENGGVLKPSREGTNGGQFTSAKWLQNAAKINALKVKYIACPNQQVDVIIAKMNLVDLKSIGVNVVRSSNETDSSRENHVNSVMDK